MALSSVRAALLACAVATPVTAETLTFSAALGNRTLGTLTFDSAGPTLLSVLDNTPLGVGDGRFEATSRPVRTDAGAAVTQYIGRSDDRTISVLLDGARAVETVVSPSSEETELSDVARVPPSVLDPVTGFGRLAAANGCPAPMRLYDGRRVIDIATARESRTETVLTCAMAYSVTAGPGHLSPFRFTSLAVTLLYGITGAQRLQRIEIEAGGFTVTFSR